jgi:DNA-binding response OmpR family regulator
LSGPDTEGHTAKTSGHARARYAPCVAGDLTLLLIEDDVRLARFTVEYLERNGVTVTHVTDGEVGLREALLHTYDAVLLDLNLPTTDGVAVCRELRARSDVPILMVTARVDEIDRVLGLEMGADDYLPKPFSPRELLARVRATVRRARGLVGPTSVLRVGPLVLSTTSMTATLHGQPLDLTGYEFVILRVLAERKGRVLTREQIMELAKGSNDEAFDRSIDVRISRLRQKLGEDPRRPSILRTVRGVGYLLAWEDEP